MVFGVMDLDYIADKLNDLGCEKVRIQGDNVMCCCPFHPEREPSFGVHPDKGANCFACFKRFHTVEDLFKELCDKKGVEYEPFSRDLPEDFNFFPQEESKSEPLNPNVIKFYKKDVERFVQKWGISREVIQRRQLCIDPTTDAECFPIFDLKNQFWGMVERYDMGRYRRYHYPSGLPRTSILFGEDQIQKNHGDLWVVEGVRDLCAIESKIPNAVAVAVGSARISDQQLDILKRYANIVLAFDNDKAGRKATKYTLNQLDTLSDVRVAKYDGKDPAEASSFTLEWPVMNWLISV